jgi:hypothetical protein
MFAQKSKRWGRGLLAACSAVALVTMFSTAVSAQQGWDKKTMVTFSQPVEIPGISAQVLPAGTYVFRLMDSPSDRHIVQIFSKDEKHLYANVLAIPNWRLKPTDKTVMTFSERRSGEPQAIRAWFYPGDNFGQEFVYPRKKAVELAKVANLPVLFIPDEVAPNIVAPLPVPTITAPPVAALVRAPVRAVEPEGREIPLEAVVELPPVQSAAALPKTASTIPLLALMGAMCLIVGYSLQRLCARWS